MTTLVLRVNVPYPMLALCLPVPPVYTLTALQIVGARLFNVAKGITKTKSCSTLSGVRC